MIFDYFSCYLEGIQLCSGETTLLPAKDVLRTICDADFQNNCFDLTVTDTDVHYDYEYAKPPKDGMFIISQGSIRWEGSIYCNPASPVPRCPSSRKGVIPQVK